MTFTFKIAFQLYNGGRKCYTVKAANREDAINKAREKARRYNLDATGRISVYRVGQVAEPFTCNITI